MKKLIAVATMIAATGAMSQSTTTTTDIDVSSQSLSERLSLSYYGEIDTDTLTTSAQTKGQRQTEFLNYLYVSYKLSSTSVLSTTFRMYLTDANKGIGQGDRYEELDQRITWSKVLSKTASTKFSFKQTIELPTTDASRKKNKIMRFKPSVGVSHKIDDLNSIVAAVGFNRDIYQKAPETIAKTSRYYISSWFSYRNTKLSEKYKFRTDIELTTDQTAARSDLNFTAREDGERLLAGVDMDILGVDVYAYTQHDPSRVVAADQLGAGVQLFKAF